MSTADPTSIPYYTPRTATVTILYNGSTLNSAPKMTAEGATPLIPCPVEDDGRYFAWTSGGSAYRGIVACWKLPLQPGQKSPILTIQARVDKAPDNSVWAFRAWPETAVPEHTTLRYGFSGTPENNIAYLDENHRIMWHETHIYGPQSVDEHWSPQVTRPLYLQLDIDDDCPTSWWGPFILAYQYSEV